MGNQRENCKILNPENVAIDVLVCSTVNSLYIGKSKSCIIKCFMNLVFYIVPSVIVSKTKSLNKSSYYKYYAIHNELDNLFKAFDFHCISHSRMIRDFFFVMSVHLNEYYYYQP